MVSGNEAFQKAQWLRWSTPILIASAIAAYFLYCTWPGISVGFDNDDVMNLHFAWRPPLSEMLLSNLVPFTNFYRPMGALYYRTCLAIFGWNPLAFRIVTFGLMLANIGLVFLLGRRLTQSAEISAVAALLFSFHGRLRQVYMSNGTVYDVLCTTFALLLLWYYARIRQRQSEIAAWQFALIVGLLIAALNAKEMAATIPALLVLYDCIYHSPRKQHGTDIKRWLWQHVPLYVVLFALVAAASWGKSRPGGVFFQHPLYTPSFTIRQFFQHERRLLSGLFYVVSFNSMGVASFYTSLFVLAAVIKRKVLWFSAWFALLAPLPIIFIAPRGFFVMYLPMAGIAIYTATLLVEGREWAWRVLWKRPPIPESMWEPERIFLMLFVALLLLRGRNASPETMLTVQDDAPRYVAQTHDDIMRLNEPLPEHGAVLLLKCRYPSDSWGPSQMFQILYRDRDLWVGRPSMMHLAVTPEIYPQFDRVIDFHGADLVVVSKGQSGPQKKAKRRLEYPVR